MGIRAQGNPLASFLDVWSNTGLDAVGAAPPGSESASSDPVGHTATGGIISDWVDPSPGNVYRTHIFTSSGTFDVSALSGTYPANVEYLVVAGGGGGGARHGGGGGAGGLLVSPAFPGIPTSQNQGTTVTVSNSSYAVVVGSGGAGGIGPDTNTNGATQKGNQGGTSSFDSISATGGGYGSGWQTSPKDGGPGGSGGSGGHASTSSFGAIGAATNYPGPTQQGHPSGTSGPGVPQHATGGGGGAGEVGQNASNPATAGRGGAGLTVYIAAPPTAPAPQNSYAGGGGGGGNTAGAGSPIGGGGAGGGNPDADGTPGTASTGGGGGGVRTPSGACGGNGGSGIVAVRYQIGTTAPTAKATGGSISLYNNKWIHTFVNSGTFVNPSSISNVEVVMVAGGGSGGLNIGGGGGAGAVLESPGTGFTFPNNTYTITIGAGGAGKTSSGPVTANTANDTTISYPGPYTWTAQRGGYGATYPDVAAQPGGSGGGGSSNPQPAAGTATAADSPTPIGTLTAYGNAGGASSGNFQGAGGGGAGGAGSANPGQWIGGPGAVGRQLPTTFRDPRQAPSDSSNPQPYQRGGGLGTPGPAGSYYVAAGGGGSAYPGNTPGNRGLGGAGGGGDGAFDANSPPNTDAQSALVNTGSGGGGAGHSPTTRSTSGSGASGIVIIAYPN
jgi:hypothetical protein